jgi:hypothetical protein
MMAGEGEGYATLRTSSLVSGGYGRKSDVLKYIFVMGSGVLVCSLAVSAFLELQLAFMMRFSGIIPGNGWVRFCGEVSQDGNDRPLPGCSNQQAGDGPVGRAGHSPSGKERGW